MKTIRSLITLIILVSTLGVYAQLNTNFPKATIKSGMLEGINQSGIKIFKGIPYAAPPVGELRWKAPKPVDAWQGVRKADEFGLSAMQLNVYNSADYDPEEMSEDCLYLNVWTPAETGNEKLPVLVYIHGGSFLVGSGSVPSLDGESMAKKGIVVVTINYRLGVFGFLAHPWLTEESTEHASGNYGFLDQVAALKWVQANISAFGGDPEQVTIAGESAGSLSVSALMCSPLSKGLFARAIGSSGSILSSLLPVPLSNSENKGQDFTKLNGYKSLTELRSAPADELLNAKGQFPTTVDGYFLTEPPIETYSKGEQAHIPLLVGWNSKEIPLSVIMKGREASYSNINMMLNFLYKGKGKQVLAMYNITDDASLELNSTDLASDLFIGHSAWKWSDIHKKTGNNKVFRYLYCHPRPDKLPGMNDKIEGTGSNIIHQENSKDSKNKIKGAVHTADIEYALGTLSKNKVYDWQPEDYALSEIFQSYYANFIKTGNPNGTNVPEWEPINGHDVAPVLYIDVKTVQKADGNIEKRFEFLDELYFPVK